MSAAIVLILVLVAVALLIFFMFPDLGKSFSTNPFDSLDGFFVDREVERERERKKRKLRRNIAIPFSKRHGDLNLENVSPVTLFKQQRILS